tara:strand:- start:356 stop:1246 length:891 start_codon:yes stop_codon:yes gene_type:complete
MSSEKIRAIERYLETVPYGENSLASEVFGPRNQETINQIVKGLVETREQALKDNNQELASSCESGIYKIHKECELGKDSKQEWAMNLRIRSNWTDHGWDDAFFAKSEDYTRNDGHFIKGSYQGTIDFDQDLNMILTAIDPTIGQPVEKRWSEVSADWEIIGDWMPQLESLLRDVQEGDGMTDSEMNYAINNLIKDNWRSMICDEDPTLDPNGISKGFRLQQILHEEFGGMSDKQMIEIFEKGGWNKEDFDPTHDTRLFTSIKNQLKRASDPNYLTDEERIKADKLMSKMTSPKKKV